MLVNDFELVREAPPVVVVVQGVYCFELHSVNSDKLGSVESKAHAELNKLLENALDAVDVFSAKFSYSLEVWRELSHEKHDLNAPVALTLQLSAGTHLIQVTVHVEFEKV